MPHRVRTPELMDDPALPAAEHQSALRGLARLNALSGAVHLLWPEVRRELTAASGERLSALDVACGDGDVLRRLCDHSRGRLVGLGLDKSPLAVRRAKMSSAGRSVRYQVSNVLRDPLPEADIVLCSLFLHHLSNRDAVRLLARMRDSARRLLIVSDLERSALNSVLVWAGARLVTRSRVVHVDSGLSARAAFTRHELRALASRAGLSGARIKPRLPARVLLVWRRDSRLSA
ncbi:methyltransferase domain-containing protein [Candidatus Poribacteria bacterium]|nr:methyltransferase domain-containing protein [Candidatus Poribacteria bacterium]